jgi:hypothetical protein
LTVRAVPDGDEYDRDTLGIRYAVDNGAKVINGSFEKLSPHKEWVYDAINMQRRKTS